MSEVQPTIVELAAVAADRDADLERRADAMAAVATRVARDGEPPPDDALAACEDSSLVDRLIRTNRAWALTAPLLVADDDPINRATGKLVATALVRNGVTGLHVAALLARVDRAADAGRAAAPALWAALCQGAAGRRAATALMLDWSRQPPPLFEQATRALGRVAPRGPGRLCAALEERTDLADGDRRAVTARVVAALARPEDRTDAATDCKD